MDELVQKVVDRAGISPEQAEQAISVVMEQLQSRLPEPIAGQLSGLLGGAGGAGAAGGVDPGDLLKGLFNR